MEDPGKSEKSQIQTGHLMLGLVGKLQPDHDHILVEVSFPQLLLLKGHIWTIKYKSIKDP